MSPKTALQASAQRRKDDLKTWAWMAVPGAAVAFFCASWAPAAHVELGRHTLWWSILWWPWLLTGLVMAYVGLRETAVPVEERRNMGAAWVLWAALGVNLFIAYLAWWFADPTTWG